MKNRRLMVCSTSAIAVAVGAIGGVVGFWRLQTALADSIAAVGVLKYQVAPTPGSSLPPPEGYYIQSSAVERVYIASETTNQFLGKNVIGFGRLSTICGIDSAPCYPLIQAESIRIASQ